MEQGSRTNIASCRKNNLNWTDLGVEDATRTHLFFLTWNRSIASKCWTLFSSSSTLLVSSSIGYKTLSRHQEKQRYGQINEREKNPEIRSKLSRQLLAENNLFVVQRSFYLLGNDFSQCRYNPAHIFNRSN